MISPQGRRSEWLALAGLGMGVLMSTLDASIVNRRPSVAVRGKIDHDAS
jgi:hypothetical protein